MEKQDLNSPNLGITTKILHSDRVGGPEHGSLHKPIHTSVAFGYEKAEDLAAVFQGKASGYAYGRQGNPTLTALEEKLTTMENSVGSLVFSTGMAAIGAICLALLKKGDHIVSSSFLFGNTNSLLNTMQGIGVDIDFVDATKVNNVSDAIKPSTKLVLVETIANPVTQIADLKAIGKLCKEKSIVYLVDNTMTSPYLFQPKNVGASLVVNSLTKYIGGHGDALGGGISDTGLFNWENFPNILDIYKSQPPKKWALVQIRKKGLRDFGAAMSPEDAHRIALGSETLALRMERSTDNAQALAEFLNDHPKIKKVNYPGLPSHPQHNLANELFKKSGALLSFELVEGLDCMGLLNHLKLVVISSNLGDNRTLAIPVAHTIFFEMGAERRKSMGIDDSLIRLSVGIEDTEDLLEDFEKALSKLP